MHVSVYYLEHGMELLMNFTIYDFTPCPITLISALMGYD